jgi:hypothetical protein
MSTDHKDLIAVLRIMGLPRCREAADVIAALVAERDAALSTLRMVRTIIDEADAGYKGNEFTYTYKQWTAAVREALAARQRTAKD